MLIALYYQVVKINFKSEFVKLGITRSEFLATARMSAHTLRRIENEPDSVRKFSFERAMTTLIYFKREKARYDRLSNK